MTNANMSLAYTLHDTGGSRSFPAPHALTQNAAASGDVAIFIGAGAGAAYRAMADAASRTAVLIELGTECLGRPHRRGPRQGRRQRARLRALPPRRRRSDESRRTGASSPARSAEALAAAKAVLEAAGFVVAVCNDFPGRILDRLLRPYFNAALRRLDEGLASAEDMDTTLRLGLGYPEGPIALLRAHRARGALRREPGAVRGARRSRVRAGAACAGGPAKGCAMIRPLAGVKVLDFSTLLPGPVCTLVLAEAGADVLKIERPGMGDEMRTYHPRSGADSANFALLNRGKHSLAIDLKAPGSAARILELREGRRRRGRAVPSRGDGSPRPRL